MSKRFSSQELHALRNSIPIEYLIRVNLKIPVKQSEGIFYFLCPLCSKFRGVTHVTTNLARCFCCQRNFNPIEFVMAVKQLNFVDTVRFLQPLLQTHPREKHRAEPPFIQSRTAAAQVRRSDLSSIAEILRSAGFNH